MYRFRYDGSEDPCDYPSNTMDDLLMLKYLSLVQAYFNEVLRVKGYVFLSEILNYLGLKEAPYTREVGWIKNGDGDGYIDFGITSAGYPMGFDLNFNCDGYILDKIE